MAQSEIDKCLLEQIKNGDRSKTSDDIQRYCKNQLADNVQSDSQGQVIPNKGVIFACFVQEELTQFDPYVITPPKMNYILPALTTNSIKVTFANL